MNSQKDSGEDPQGRKHRPDQSRTGRALDYSIAAAIIFLTLVQGPYTIDRVGISWDEPFYFQTSKQYTRWASDLGRPQAFAADTLDAAFGLKPKKNDHPTLTRIIGALTYSLLDTRCGEFRAYRMSAPIIFGLLLALAFLHVSEGAGRPAGLATAVLLAVMPRLFTHNHIAATDAPLCFFWLLTAHVFMKACERPALSPLGGLAFGLCMAVKFTGFLAAIPLLVFGLLYYRRRALVPLLCLALGPVVFVALQPWMWHAPVSGFFEFLRMHLSQGAWNPHWVLFLGEVYDFSGPWYYAPFMVLVTTPEVCLALFVLGLGVAIRGRLKDRLMGSSLIHFTFLVGMTMLPVAPVFDGVRLFLPTFVFLAIISGLGFRAVVGWADRRVKRLSVTPSPKSRPSAVAAVLGLALLAAASSPLLGEYPLGLEYYNSLIGGIKGARDRGMETTYWWTVVNRGALERVSGKVPTGSTLGFFPMDPDLHELYAELGWLPPDMKIVDGRESDFILVLSRPCWDFPKIFAYLGTPRQGLLPVDSLVVDEVPLWVLYKRM